MLLPGSLRPPPPPHLPVVSSDWPAPCWQTTRIPCRTWGFFVVFFFFCQRGTSVFRWCREHRFAHPPPLPRHGRWRASKERDALPLTQGRGRAGGQRDGEHGRKDVGGGRRGGGAGAMCVSHRGFGQEWTTTRGERRGGGGVRVETRMETTEVGGGASGGRGPQPQHPTSDDIQKNATAAQQKRSRPLQEMRSETVCRNSRTFR